MIYLLLTVLAMANIALVISHFSQGNEIHFLRRRLGSVENQIAKQAREVHVHHYAKEAPRANGLLGRAGIGKGMDL